MGLSFTMQEAKFHPIPEDHPVRAVLNEMKERTFQYTEKSTGQQREGRRVQWLFKVTEDGLWKDRIVRGETSADMTADDGNRLAGWFGTLLGREIVIGMNIDADDVVGLPCYITVRQEPDRRDPEKKWERVEDVLPAEDSGFSVSEPPF